MKIKEEIIKIIKEEAEAAIEEMSSAASAGAVEGAPVPEELEEAREESIGDKLKKVIEMLKYFDKQVWEGNWKVGDVRHVSEDLRYAIKVVKEADEELWGAQDREYAEGEYAGLEEGAFLIDDEEAGPMNERKNKATYAKIKENATLGGDRTQRIRSLRKLLNKYPEVIAEIKGEKHEEK